MPRKAPGKTTYTGVNRSEEMSHTDTLTEQVKATRFPVYRTTKAQVIAGYQEKYEGKMGKGGWKQHIVHDLSEMTGKKSKNFEKRFDSGSRGGRDARINTPEPKNKAQYVALGRKLPPIGQVYPASFTITFVVDIKISDHCGNIRGPYTVHISGDDAQEFAKKPSWDMVMAYVFGDGGPPDYDNPVEDICAVIMLRVS